MVLPPASSAAQPLGEGIDELRVADGLDAYRALVGARVLEERWDELEKEGAHWPRRLEAGSAGTVVSAALAIGREDWVFGEGNELALALVRGATLSDFIAHAFGRGPNPWSVRARRTLGADLRNGAHVTHGAGVAWAAKIERRDVAVLVTFASDITTTGEFHNGINFAGVYKAPVVFLCRTPERAASGEHAADVGSAYGILGRTCSGADFQAVAQAVREARKRAVAGLGPTFLEVSVPDADGALASLRRSLEERGLLDAEREERIGSEAAAEIDRAVSEFVVPTRRRPE
ncbi:MAG TPA: thiamine pyrophosphate-dependent enzyme [Polyangiaceae bacterium]|nr:thiamine pyrophosphate-dependent enzyme [Polyangiaceae bacterium]